MTGDLIRYALMRWHADGKLRLTGHEQHDRALRGIRTLVATALARFNTCC